ncbi:unnamed protein product [Arabis nemorensis]|uniref:Gnk2-homologous domain-containing protein n=1 Tax=Arabis nemorensis TaxID=586526 RepID=A0A565CUU1_9BRAS|nr:unnamed protein product [Arabis nemorensis]
MSPVKTTTILISSVVFAAVVYLLTNFSSSPADHIIQDHCSEPNYFPKSFFSFNNYFPISSSYESNVNSLLTSFVNSASVSSYNNFTVDGNPKDTVHGLYQCRGDPSYGAADCVNCVSQAVRRLRNICAGAPGGWIQLEGCLVKYDNVAFVGVPDKTLVRNSCVFPFRYKPDEVARTNALLRYLVASYGFSYRARRLGEAKAVAQCTEDLSAIDCQDCLIEAILWQKPVCGNSGLGEVYLAKCYVRYSSPGASGYESKKTFGSIFFDKMMTTTRRQFGDEYKSLFYRGQEFIPSATCVTRPVEPPATYQSFKIVY